MVTDSTPNSKAILISCNTGAKKNTLACRKCTESMDRDPDRDFDEPDFKPAGNGNDRLMDIIRECIDNYSPCNEQEESKE